MFEGDSLKSDDMYVNCGWQTWLSSSSYFRAWNWNGREGTHTHTYPIERSSNLAIVILVESPGVPSTWWHVQFHQLPNFLIFQREHWIRRNAFFIYGRKSDNYTTNYSIFFGNLCIELWIHFFFLGSVTHN